MTDQPMRALSRSQLAALCVMSALLPGAASTQPSSVEIAPNNAGPVYISDLQVLLGDKMQFQMFDFYSGEDLCLYISYTHELDGREVARASGFGLCNHSGKQRLIVAMKPTEDGRQLWFGLHQLDTGVGGSVASRPLSIGDDVSGLSLFSSEELFRSEGTLLFDREVTLFRWSYGDQRPGHGPKHDVRIAIRAGENSGGVRTFSGRVTTF